MAKYVDEKIFPIPPILNILNRVRQSDTTDKICFNGFVFGDACTYLASAISVNEEITSTEKSGLIHSALFKVKGKEITKESLLTAVKAEESGFLQRKEQRFVVATHLSLRYLTGLVSLTLRGHRLNILANLPEKFDRSLIERQLTNTGLKVPEFVVAATIGIPARTPFGAISKALDLIDAWRGQANCIINHTLISLQTSGPPKPVNRIQTGPFHTVHNPDGTLASKSFQYDAAYPRHLGAADVQSMWPRIKTGLQQIRDVLGKSREKDFYDTMFRRYARALDGEDHHGSFLKLWSLLEYLTQTERADYKKMVERVLFLSTDRDYDDCILRHLKERRNSFVHTSDENHEPLTLLFQLKWYVEDLMHMHLASTAIFKKRHQFWELLDLPHEMAILRQQIATRKIGLKLRSSWEKSAKRTP